MFEGKEHACIALLCSGPRECVPSSIPDLLSPLSPSRLQMEMNVPAISPVHKVHDFSDGEKGM